MIVKLKDIVDTFEEINDEWSGYLNLDTGEISMIGNRYIVITSYSIHYTKLYEKSDQPDRTDSYKDDKHRMGFVLDHSQHYMH